MSELTLRPYQDEVRAAISVAMREGVRRPLVVMPTGAGKTALAAYMTGTSIARGVAPVWFLVHRRELMTQTARAFADAGINVGMVAQGYAMQPTKPAQVVLIDSLPKRMHLLPPPRVLIPDEAHHSVAKKWAAVVDAYPKAWSIGLTATPERLDGKGLGAHFDRIIEGPKMRWLIDNGFLADYRLFAPPSISTEGVHTVAGDFNKKELEAALKRSTIVGDAVNEYRKHAAGKRAIVRSLSIEDSKEVAAAFTAAGFSAVHIDGKTRESERNAKFEAFKRGDISILCNVDLFGEGVDVPGIECAIDLRPTKSLTLYLQFIGRALRPAPGKSHAIIIDHAGNIERHGLPDDDRTWSLDGRPKRDVRKIFTCKKCYGVFDHPFSVCPSCGAMTERVSQGRAGPEQVAGELVEVDKTRKRTVFDDARKQASRSLESLVEYGRAKGYKESWAKYVWDARQQKLSRA